MNDNQNSRLLDGLNQVENLAKGRKIKRLLHNPSKYLGAQLFRLHFWLTGKGIRIKTKTFWNDPFVVELPAATDIYLTGGKTHDSEIRLSRFLIKNLHEGDSFIDIGSHFGFFSKLAQKCLNGIGNIIAIEPSRNSFQILNLNIASSPIVNLINSLIGEKTGTKEFFEFPALYSEYNTSYPSQFDNNTWFEKIKIIKEVIDCITLDDLVKKHELVPTIIKIDTEGAELDVIKGATAILSSHKDVTIVMEYLSDLRGNQSHRSASLVLKEFHFIPFIINKNGDLEECHDIEKHIRLQSSESDNIVFRRAPEIKNSTFSVENPL